MSVRCRPLAAMPLALAAWLIATAPIAAAIELQTTLWNENFTDCSDWTLATLFCGGGNLGKVYLQGTAGPAYRNGDSAWVKATYAKFKINATDVNTGTAGTPGACTPNCENIRIWDYLFSNGTPTGISPPGNGNDALLIRRTDNFREGIEDFHQFEVYQSDDGSQVLVAQHDLGTDPHGLALSFNLTVDPTINRYWINWSCAACADPKSGAITNTWTDVVDGWETEHGAFNLSIWTFQDNNYVSPGNMLMSDLSLFGLNEGNFTVEASPATITVAPGAGGLGTVFVNGTGGFAGAVDVSTSNWPAGITGLCTPTTVSASGSCTLGITVADTVPIGNYTLTVNGTNTSAGLTLQDTFDLLVRTAAPATEETRRLHVDFVWIETSLGTQFYDRSIIATGIASWTWSFGDHYGSRRQNPFHPFPCAGEYEVVLNVTDSYGQWRAIGKTVRVEQSSLFCGYLQRSEQSLDVRVPGGIISISTAAFALLAALSAVTLVAGFEIRWRGHDILPWQLRVFLLCVSVFMLLVISGVFAPLWEVSI